MVAPVPPMPARRPCRNRDRLHRRRRHRLSHLRGHALCGPHALQACALIHIAPRHVHQARLMRDAPSVRPLPEGPAIRPLSDLETRARGAFATWGGGSTACRTAAAMTSILALAASEPRACAHVRVSAVFVLKCPVKGVADQSRNASGSRRTGRRDENRTHLAERAPRGANRSLSIAGYHIPLVAAPVPRRPGPPSPQSSTKASACAPAPSHADTLYALRAPRLTQLLPQDAGSSGTTQALY